MEDAGRTTSDRRAPHRDVLALLDVPEPDPGLEQRPLEGERAAEEKRDEVVAPVRRDVGDLVGQHAVLVDPVARDVRAQNSRTVLALQGNVMPSRIEHDDGERRATHLGRLGERSVDRSNRLLQG